MATKQIKFHRLGIPTVYDSLVESVGETLETVGAYVVAGQRRPRPFNLSLPLHGDPDDIDGTGNRMRRQLRSLLDNALLTNQALYFYFSIDPELNGWLVTGGGDISYADGGVTFQDYKLDLQDCYRVGTLKTHRLARRIELYDRRLITTARDYRGTIFSTDFSAFGAKTNLGAPLVIGATDTVSSAIGYINATPTWVSQYGTMVSVQGNPRHGEVMHFETAERAWDDASVVVFDRRNNLVQSSPTVAGDQDPQTFYGWEEVYGPNWPSYWPIVNPAATPDIPVMQNGLCRLRWDNTRSAFILDTSSAGGVYTERGRFTIWGENNAAAIQQGVTLATQSARLIEYTPERAVILVVLHNGSIRLPTYVTLQRDWLAPRFEVYPNIAGSGYLAGAQVRYTAKTDTSAPTVTAGRTSGGTVSFGSTGFYTFLATDSPWAYMANVTTALENIGVAPSRAQDTIRNLGLTDNTAYGVGRPTMALHAPFGTAAAGYLGAWFTLTGASGLTSNAQAPGRVGDNSLWDLRGVPELVAR